MDAKQDSLRRPIRSVGWPSLALLLPPTVAAALLSFLGWHGEGEFGLILLLWGAVLAWARTVTGIALVSVAYYLALGWESVPSLRAFFDLSLALSFFFWLLHAVVNASAWLLPALMLWCAQRLRVGRSPALRATPLWVPALLIGSVLSVIPPWAGYSWAHPMMVAGQMYPGGGWWALLAVLVWWGIGGCAVLWMQRNVASGASLRHAARAWVTGAALALLTSLVWTHTLAPASNPLRSDGKFWHAVQTDFGPVRTPQDAAQRWDWMRGQVKEVLNEPDFRSSVVVFPEGVIGPHRGSVDFFFAMKGSALSERENVVLLHANRSIDGADNADDKIVLPGGVYSAVMAYGYGVAQGVDSAGFGRVVYRARYVVPGFFDSANKLRGSRKGSALADLGGAGLVVMAICYEGFLMEHWLRALIDSSSVNGGKRYPTRVVAMSNLWFLDGVAARSAFAKQDLSMRRGAGLLGLPLTLAVNGGQGGH